MELPLLRSARLPGRQLLGLFLVLALLAAGRVIRHGMLLGPEGHWRNELWLDGLLEAATPVAEVPVARPVLTSPLPVNTCSEDSLTLLPGVGAVLAGRIAAARAAGMVFRVPGDLCRIKGIGPILTGRLAPHIIFAAPRPDKSGSAQESR